MPEFLPSLTTTLGPTNILIREALTMRQAVREYMRASAKLFGLAFQERAVTETEREAIVSYAQELAHRFKPSRPHDDQPPTALPSVSDLKAPSSG